MKTTAHPLLCCLPLLLLTLLVTTVTRGQDPGVPPGWILVDDMILPETGPEATFQATPWPGGTVYYDFDASVTAAQMAIAIDAMAEWTAAANVVFQPRTNEPNYVRFVSGSVNTSYVGMIGGQQAITIVSWDYPFIVCHEICHALGFYHEHQRPDRDTYVTINWPNIQSGYAFAFSLLAGASTYTTYDFDSVMHYSQCAFSIGCPSGYTCPCTQHTIDINSGYSAPPSGLGQVQHLSAGDALGMAFQYGAPLPPAISGLNPPAVTAGAASFTLSILGTRFHRGTNDGAGVQGSLVRWNGTPLQTTYVSPGTLQAFVPASLVANPGPVVVTVENPSPGGGTSAPYAFSIWPAVLSNVAGGTVRRVSIDYATGGDGNGSCFGPVLSGDGRYLAFFSLATNLVPGDTNGQSDIFVSDQATGTMERVNLTSTGGEATGTSQRPGISSDGRYVAFLSAATNLVPGDTNDKIDVFVRDRVLGTTTRVSVSSQGVQGDLDSAVDTPDRISISDDGDIVAFSSDATNLVPGDTNMVDDIFVHRRSTGVTTRVNVSTAGQQATGVNGGVSYGAQLSADGRYVAFTSWASNLVAGDANGTQDVFVHDRVTGVTERVSIGAAGIEGNGQSGENGFVRISANGQFVLFGSYASNLVPNDTNGTADVFVRDRINSQTERVNVTSSGSQASCCAGPDGISYDGRFIVLTSSAGDLVPGDTNNVADVFVRDRQLGTTIRISVDPSGAQTNGFNASGGASISTDGSTVAFHSYATNLVPFDGTGFPFTDIFVRPRFPRITATSPAGVGTTIALALEAPADSGRPYAVASSLGYWPGVALDFRRAYLDLDPVFYLSLSTPSIFAGYVGTIYTGLGSAAIIVPPIPSLSGVVIYTAFATLDPTAPSGIAGISNTLALTL
jgi:hypothetical protein